MSGGAGGPDWEQVEQVMASFLALPDQQRSAYLAQQPEPLRAEVESLVAAYRKAGSFLGSDIGKPLPTADLLRQMKLMVAEANSAEDTDFAVKPGTQLGSYRIEKVIGKGGMGVVYRAVDTRLNRPVAVKFLFDGLADAAARHRFQREAQMASSLNHPHILTVYDAGDFEGRQYLVTEFVDGGTLKEWARAQQHTWREIVALLAGVADGLAAAHAAGILHRDIKPDNILVGKNGYAKLSDFGLAKLEQKVGPEELTHTLQGTRPGMIVGTFAYMSPEQASGRPTDARGDIFSFGIVLYELLAGHRPFAGATDRELLQTIIQSTAPPLGADVPYALRMIVEKALENAPADRYQSTRDLVVDLRRLTRQSGETKPETNSAPVASPAPAKLWRVALVILVLLLAAGILMWRLDRPAAQAPRQVVQFDIAPPPGSIFTPTISRQYFAISPDGKRLAFTATSAAGSNIWIRELASLEMHPVPGTDGAWSMYWAPDSRSIFYSVKRTLKETNLETGSGRSVAELPSIPQLATWRPNGNLLLYLGPGNLQELRPGDGTLKKSPVFEDLRWPQFIPGDRLIYTTFDKQRQQSQAMVVDYPSGKPVFLMRTDSRVQYAPPLHPGESGHLVFVRDGSLLAQPFDADRLQLAGEPFPIAQNVIYYHANFAASVSVSQNGVLVYHAGFPNAQLQWYDRNGKEVSEVGRPSPYWGNVRVSRDGRRIAAPIWDPENGTQAIWIFSAAGPESRRFTFYPEIDRRPVWSPDGTRLAFGRSHIIGPPQLTILDATGNGTPEAFTGETPADHSQGIPTDWSPDGRFIAFDDGVGEEQRVAWIATVATHTYRPLLKSASPQWGTAFSPDGKRIAFVSMESGRPEVYVQPFEGAPSPHVAGERHQVSRNGAWLVRWRGDGRELFYIGLDNQMHAVPVQGALEFGEPKELFLIPGVSQYSTTRDFQFDVSPDGQRFILPTTGSVPPPPFTVIENWQDKFRH